MTGRGVLLPESPHDKETCHNDMDEKCHESVDAKSEGSDNSEIFIENERDDEKADGRSAGPTGRITDRDTKKQVENSGSIISRYINILRYQHPNVPWIIFISLLSSITGSIWGGTLLSMILFDLTQSNTKVRWNINLYQIRQF